MAKRGILLPASLSCIIAFTFVSCTLGQNIKDEIMQRLDKFGKLISDLKMENSNLKAEITDIKRENIELVETVKDEIWTF